jgi:hypothetical protein
MKHWEEKLATCVYNHCNIYNIPIHFLNIRMKYLQHTFETCEILETYVCNMHFSTTSPYCWGEWRLVDVWSLLRQRPRSRSEEDDAHIEFKDAIDGSWRKGSRQSSAPTPRVQGAGGP